MNKIHRKALYLAMMGVLAQPASAALALNETFDSKEKPAGWDVVSSESPYARKDWMFNDPNGFMGELNFPSNIASVDGNAVKSELRTPTLDLTAYKGVLLKFKHFLSRSNNSIYNIQVSTDGGATWTSVKNYNTEFRKGLMAQTVDLSSSVGEKNNVRIAFVAENPEAWILDDVQVDGITAPSAPTNVQISLGRNSVVNLSWQNADESAEFLIERAGPDGNFQLITPKPVKGKNFTDERMDGNTAYQYRVKAKNIVGESGASPAATITTGDRTTLGFDLIVSYYDTYANATAAERKQAIEENFRYMADSVFEMSNGAHKLGNITIYTDGAKRNVADVIWEKNRSVDKDAAGNPELCWFNAYTGGRVAKQGPSKRIQHCDIGNELSHYDSLKDPKRGGYTLGHEFGHYFYKLLDEYQGGKPTDTRNERTNPGSPFSTDTVADGAIMHDTTKAEEGDLRWLNFSTALNNRGGNAHFRVYGKSAWDTLVQDPENDSDLAKKNNSSMPRIFYPELQKVAPKAGEEPSIELPAKQADARKSLNIIWKQGAHEPTTRRLRLGNLPAAVVAAVDVSQAVSTEQLDDIKTALKTWVKDANAGDYVGIVAVGNNGKVISPLTKIIDAAKKDEVIASINNLSVSTEESNLAEGLQTALTQLQSAPDSYGAAVYLISSGDNANTSDPFKSLQTFQEKSILLHTIGLSNQEDAQGLLIKLAEDTNGLYWESNGALEDLAMGLDEADQYTSPAINVTVAEQAKVISGEETFSFNIDAGLGRINFRATYDGVFGDATLTLSDPSGNSFVLPADYCETTSESLSKQTICGASVDQLTSGLWKLHVKANRPNVNFNYRMQGVAKDNNKIIYASVEAAGEEKVAFPQPLIVTASVGNNLPITDVEVSAVLETPDGRKQPFSLIDEKREGTYLGKVHYTMNGLHKIHVHFSNLNGKANYSSAGVSYIALPKGVSEPNPFTPVGVPFTRVETAAIHIDGVPPNLATQAKGATLNGSVTTAAFTNHIQTSKNQIGNGVSISGSEKIRLASMISPDSKHLNQPADILIAAKFKPVGGQEMFYVRNGASWEALKDPIQAAYSVEKLESTLPVEVIDAAIAEFDLKGDFEIFTGYRLKDGNIVFNATSPLKFSVK
jgi:hypothetical protein